MKHTLIVKNMVCNRCKSIIEQHLNNEGFQVESIELGKVVVQGKEKNDLIKLEEILKNQGFELIKELSEVLIEKIKIIMIEMLENNNSENVLSELPIELGKNYSVLSRIFSKSEGMTLEKYLINLKIEKVKENIQLKQLNFSEIAYSLNYNNSSHLAKQFKSITGISMSQYRKLQDWNRKELDKIV
ncbi:helix-turn-helix domain-containing protein [Psychroserpens burtonensis]|uniref:Helix-turn-helix domain-containing protein n=1 Tax=Psychroserpens burtonensis TaxID=49278 RepID=A0A5C7B4R2_9FLAO|nr:helix-turn-helix transcriptional regulator [Psychroserpens burtonensis]TXE16570.1 helix-turn-helix domain-containing protein [Psychroserpens burtonensis]